MSNIDKGGPAFPVPSELAAKLGCVSSESDAGMSIRDYFAGQVLCADYMGDYAYAERAERAYKAADAMIKARESNL